VKRDLREVKRVERNNTATEDDVQPGGIYTRLIAGLGEGTAREIPRNQEPIEDSSSQSLGSRPKWGPSELTQGQSPRGRANHAGGVWRVSVECVWRAYVTPCFYDFTRLLDPLRPTPTPRASLRKQQPKFLNTGSNRL